MKRFLTLSIVLLVFLPGAYLYACTAFCISKGDTVLVGNNEDYIIPDTKVFYVPAEKGKYGRVIFGFDNAPQGGMNEKGLVCDGFSAPLKKVKNSLDKPNIPSDQLWDKVMSECATVDEVLEILGKYNLAFMESGMAFFADANGDSAIIEGDNVVRKKGKYQVVTNFRQSETRKEDITCGRYKIATAMLEDADDISVDLAKRVLAATHLEGPGSRTLYSNVYDLKRRIVYLYHFHNFQNEVVIDLKAELAKGARKIDLPDLFPKTFVAENFKNSSPGELEERKAKYTRIINYLIIDGALCLIIVYTIRRVRGRRKVKRVAVEK
jgi:penicillin V acylase-like amidase (Ntn superfamily)